MKFQPRPRLLLACAAVALGTFVWLNHINPPFVFGEDSVRDQLMARDCADLGRCRLIGLPTSIADFYQGAVWPDLVIGVRLLGGDTADERALVVALLALGVATLFAVVWQWLRPSLALPAAFLFVAGLSLDLAPSRLEASSVAAFPDAIATAGILCFGLSGSLAFLVLSAFALGAGINVHLAAAILLPPMMVIVMLARVRPWRGLFAFVTVFAATYFITSRAALLGNFMHPAVAAYVLPALAGGLSLLLVAMRFGRRFRLLSLNARAWIIGLVLLLPFVSVVEISFGGTFFNHYLYPVLGPAAVLGAALIALPFEIAARWLPPLRWAPATATLAGVAFIALQTPEAMYPSKPWTIAEAGAIAEHVARRGWSYEDLFLHLQSPACRELLVGLSMEMPPPPLTSNIGQRQLQIVTLQSDATGIAAPQDIVRLGPRAIAVVREVDSWLQPESITACRRPIAPGSTSQCSALGRRDPELRIPERFLFDSRANTQAHNLDLPPPFIASYEIPLSAPAGESRELTLADADASECGWHIVRAEGVAVEGELPARHLLMHSTGGGDGRLVIERIFGTEACHLNEMDRRYPPCVLETKPGDPLLALARASS